MQKYFLLVYLLLFVLQSYGADSTDTIVESDLDTDIVVANEIDSVVTTKDNIADSSSVSLKKEAQNIDSTTTIAADTTIKSMDTAAVSSDRSIDTTVVGKQDKIFSDTVSDTVSPAKLSLKKPENKVDSKKVDLLMPVLRKKRRTAIIGNVLFATGIIIKYGMILPQSKKIELEDTEGQLALISPGLLSFGLKVAGTTMSCMRTSEVIDSYEKHIGSDVPRNLSWFTFFSGFGLMLGSQMAGYMAVMMESDNKENNNYSMAATGIDIAQDVVWAFTNIYSIIYINRLGEKAETSRVSLVPGVNSSGAPALAVLIKF
jgi:hypothetical protein